MNSRTPRNLALPALAVLTVLLPGDGWAHRRGPVSFPFAETYTTLKVGGYDLDSINGGGDSPDGVFAGLELGTSPSPFVELGFSVDWFHRRQGREQILIVDAPYELPVSGVVELDGTSTDLVPFGGVVRLRFPVSSGRFVPFVSGQLSYDILRLEYHEIVTHGGTQTVADEEEFFHGWGSTVALGLESKLDSRFGLLAEVGVHRSEPGKNLEIRGVPVKGKVDAGGGFARFGMRFAFP